MSRAINRKKKQNIVTSWDFSASFSSRRDDIKSGGRKGG